MSRTIEHHLTSLEQYPDTTEHLLLPATVSHETKIRNPITVKKFGGDSMAHGENVGRSADIARNEVFPQITVVSAPGRFGDEEKVTDLLRKINESKHKNEGFDPLFDRLRSRYLNAGSPLHDPSRIDGLLDEVYRGIEEGRDNAWVESRGEWMMMHIFAGIVDGSVADPADYITLRNGKILPETYKLIRDELPKGSIDVMAGYYAADKRGNIVLFKRGGSDITASIAAAGVDAYAVELYKDVPGVLAADPEYINDAATIPELTFKEMREMGYRGASVVQEDAVLPLQEKNIPLFVKSLYEPEKMGTKITKERISPYGETIVSIAGKPDFMSFRMGKSNMNTETGFIADISQVFEEHGASIDHIPSGMDRISVVVEKNQLNGEAKRVEEELRKKVDTLEVRENLGIVCVVGQEIPQYSTKVLTQVASALGSREIEIEEFTYAADNSMVFTVEGARLSDAINIIYDVSIRNKS